MVADYYADIRDAFAASARHLTRDGRVVVDIGNSQYGGVRVPTDELLGHALESIGLRLDERVVLRKRQSRSGGELKQVLMIFSVGKIEHTKRRKPPLQKWRAFEADLPHRQGDRTKRNWGIPLHSLCSYGGKMKPSVAEALVDAFVEPGSRILDPFAGVGTIPSTGSTKRSADFRFRHQPGGLPHCPWQARSTCTYRRGSHSRSACGVH